MWRDGGSSRFVHATAAFSLLAALLLFGHTLDAQTAAPRAQLIGVFDATNGAPIPGVQIVDELTGSYTTTNLNGAASLGFIAFRGNAGLIELRKIGYTPVQVAIVRTDTIPITQLLEQFASLPASVTTETFRVDLDAGLREGFERRCAVANASCLRAADMARRPASSLGDIIGDSKNMLVGQCGVAPSGPFNSRSTPRGCALLMKSPFGACAPRILVNGFPWNQRALGPPIDAPGAPPGYAPFGPGDVDGIEIYPPERPVPARFGRETGCGVIVIWTK